MPTMILPANIAPFARGVAFLLERDGQNMSARQIGLLLHVARDQAGETTVRGAAAALGVSKPAITRAADRLTSSELLVRKIDPNDRRSIFLVLTCKGVAVLNSLADAVAA